ncbi:hypothetical protein QE418_000579 [Microbacterium testaceum]|uniref:hypothetical protein n=1 Tax=Microbacterium TaxID=33882 RepID=UPI002789DAB8|nr:MULTISPECIES: hypothetical protein [Microbacterium]MDQ1111131.1 hypothetical protein [Microbacterium testaceum]MDR6098330.1 hypothetical protein [Microbacterium sp. SORGH_AS_0454]
MAVSVQVTMTNRFGELTGQIRARLIAGENKAAERALTLSRQMVPFDTGHLSGSGTVEPAVDAEQGASVVYDTPYAARLHEHPEYNFSKDSNPNAQGKYLENAVVQNKKELGDIIRNEVQGG